MSHPKETSYQSGSVIPTKLWRYLEMTKLCISNAVNKQHQASIILAIKCQMTAYIFVPELKLCITFGAEVNNMTSPCKTQK